MKIINIVKKIAYKCPPPLLDLSRRIKNIAANNSKIHITCGKTSFWRIKKDVSGQDNLIVIGDCCAIDNAAIRIRGNSNRIVFSDRCTIGKDCSFWMEGNNIEIIVGKDCSFVHTVHLCAQEDNSKIIIGDDCMFSNNIIIRTSDSHPIYDKATDVRINYAADVVIGNHVWIAPNSKVFKGAVIGDGAIIGSETLVTNVVPQNALCVGIPARIVKSGIYWTRESLF